MIKNLKVALPELGKIKSGVKGKEIASKEGNKFRPPQKLDHFIITTMERDTEGDFIVDLVLMETLKKSDAARVNKDGNLTGIPIQLLYNNIDLNFPTRYACYVGGKCVCSGDGEEAHTRDGRTVKCPCDKQDMGYQGKDKCKINGKLFCVIDGTTSVGACHVLRTTSFNTVQSIVSGLSFIQAAAGGMLAFLPLQLVLTPKTTVIPSTGTATTVYVASIVYNGNINELRQAAICLAKDRAHYIIEMDTIETSAKQLMLTAVESPEEAKDIQEEFYPDAVEISNGHVLPTAAPVAEPAKKKLKNKKVKEEDLKPASTPTPAPAPEVKTEPASVPVKEAPKLESASTGPIPITDNQKRNIVRLKKALGIVDNIRWSEMISIIAPGVKTALKMTTEEAAKFISYLEASIANDDIPL